MPGDVLRLCRVSLKLCDRAQHAKAEIAPGLSQLVVLFSYFGTDGTDRRVADGKDPDDVGCLDGFP